MNIAVDSRYEYVHELRPSADLQSVPWHSESVMSDVAELVEETFIRGVLSDSLPAEIDDLRASILPLWKSEPVVDRIEVTLAAGKNGARPIYRQEFATGRWVRSSQLTTLKLCQEGTLPKGQLAHQMLLGMKCSEPPPVVVPPLAPPPFADQSLDDFGVRQFGQGDLVPDRPVLVNQRLASDAVRRCREAGMTETGGAVLGKIVRLNEPLPNTQTRFVTLLSSAVEDPRHVGAPLSFTFSPEGLAEAAQFGELRGLGETVQTVFHTHGWATECGNCNRSANCPLADGKPSLQDYQLLESLFSSKATLLPIAGRKPGEPARQPVLQIHAWRGGEMKPIRWQEYSD